MSPSSAVGSAAQVRPSTGQTPRCEECAQDPSWRGRGRADPAIVSARRSSRIGSPSARSAGGSRAADGVMEVERRVGRGEVRADVRAAALLAQQRARGDQPRRADRGRRAGARAPRASRTRPASRHSASRVSGPATAAGSSGAGGVARLGARLARAPPARPGRRTRSTRSASSRRAGWRRAGPCTPTRRPRRGPARCVAPSRSETIPPIP